MTALDRVANGEVADAADLNQYEDLLTGDWNDAAYAVTLRNAHADAKHLQILKQSDSSNLLSVTDSAITATAPTSVTGNLTVASGQVLAANGTSGAPGISFAADTNLGFYRSGADTMAIAGTLLGIQAQWPVFAVDDYASVQAAIDAAEAAGGGVVLFGTGTYTSGALTITEDNVILRGQGLGATRLVISAAEDFLITIGVGGTSSDGYQLFNGIFDMTIATGATQTAGGGIKLNRANHTWISHVVMGPGGYSGPVYDGVSMIGSSGHLHIVECEIGTTRHGLHVNDTVGGSGGNNNGGLWVTGGHWQGVAGSNSALYFTGDKGFDGVYVTNLLTETYGFGFRMGITAGGLSYVHVANSVFDHCRSAGVFMDPAAGGFRKGAFVNCGFNGEQPVTVTTSRGIWLAPTVSGTIYDLGIIGCRIADFGTAGIEVETSSVPTAVKNLSIVGNRIVDINDDAVSPAPGVGIRMSANARDFVITGNSIGSGSDAETMGDGIILGATTKYCVVSDNIVIDTTRPLTDNGISTAGVSAKSRIVDRNAGAGVRRHASYQFAYKDLPTGVAPTGTTVTSMRVAAVDAAGAVVGGLRYIAPMRAGRITGISAYYTGSPITNGFGNVYPTIGGTVDTNLVATVTVGAANNPVAATNDDIGLCRFTAAQVLGVDVVTNSLQPVDGEIAVMLEIEFDPA